MRTPNLHDVFELVCFRVYRIMNFRNRGDQFVYLFRRGDMHGRRKRVVGALRHVDVIVWVHGLLCAERAVRELDGTVADDFIPAMKKLIDRPKPPEHIVIETSGLALRVRALTALAQAEKSKQRCSQAGDGRRVGLSRRSSILIWCCARQENKTGSVVA